MTLRLFGAGGAFSRRYGTTCSMVTLRSGQRWLIDCGRQAPDQLHAAGFVWHDISGQIVTHVHGDHVYGMEDFAFIRYFESRGADLASSLGGVMPRLIAHSAVRAEIWETLAPSLRYLSDGRGNGQAGTLGHYFEVIAAAVCEPRRTTPGTTPSTSSPTTCAWSHARPCTSPASRPARWRSASTTTRLQRIAWWSGDCIVDADMLKALEPRTSIFFHDCTFVDYPGQVHGFFDKLETCPSVCATRWCSCTTRTTSTRTVNGSRPPASAWRCRARSTTSCPVSGSASPRAR
jgi:ribonuclease BN (tRNA processing enzyme)